MSEATDPEVTPVAPEKISWPAVEISALQALCVESANLLADGLLADRIAIVYRAEEGHLAVGAKLGYPRFTLYHNAPVSLSVLEDSATHGRTTLSADARVDHETPQTLTLQLSEAVSLLCVPLFDSEGKPVGAIYADTVGRSQAFRHNELRFAREFASWLGARLLGHEGDPAPRSRKAVHEEESKLKAQALAKAKAEEESAARAAAAEAEDDQEKPGLLMGVFNKVEQWIYYS